jgi:hypothetical protein
MKRSVLRDKDATQAGVRTTKADDDETKSKRKAKIRNMAEDEWSLGRVLMICFTMKDGIEVMH